MAAAVVLITASTSARAATKPPPPSGYSAKDSADQFDRKETQRPRSTRDYFLPAAEIVGFEFVLNQFNRNFASDEEDYQTNAHTIRKNFRRGFGIDRDQFTINQIGHPYQGSIYYGFARFAGFNFWESMAFTGAGSLLWEEAGETTRPSLNDQITTTFGGSFLGEPLVRMAKLFWADGSAGDASVENLDAAVASPPLAIDKLAVGHTSDSNPPNRPPRVFSQFHLGVLDNFHISAGNQEDAVDETVAAAMFEMEYGLPGEPGYTYSRPFDYFNFEGTLDSNRGDPIESVFVRGLLYGEDYSVSSDYHGVYGLYGTYDYLAPGLFRAGSTGLAIGTTGEWRMERDVTLEGTLLAGGGFGAAGTIHDTDGAHDYHYGGIPQSMAALRLRLGDRTTIDLSGREYYVVGSSSEEDSSNAENVAAVQAAITWRIFGPNAVSVMYGSSWRNAPLEATSDQHQQVETVGLYYTYLPSGRLGPVPERNHVR